MPPHLNTRHRMAPCVQTATGIREYVKKVLKRREILLDREPREADEAAARRTTEESAPRRPSSGHASSRSPSQPSSRRSTPRRASGKSESSESRKRSALISARPSGVDWVYIGVDNEYPRAVGFVARKDSGVGSLSDLSGKTIGFFRGSTSHYAVLTVLKRQGIATSQVKLLQLEPAQQVAARIYHVEPIGSEQLLVDLHEDALALGVAD